MSLSAFGAVAVAFALDYLFAEFPERIHPVVAFGRIAGVFDRAWIAPRLVGGLLALALPLVAAAIAAVLVGFALAVHPAVGAVVAGLVLFATTSRRMLLDVASDVVELTDEDLDGARTRLPALAGRDPSTLSAGQVRSAALESAAENLADGLVGPLLAFGIGAIVGLPVGAAAAAWVKGMNTLDSMLGYTAKPVGWASARLDDVVMYVPARASAALLALAATDPGALLEARAPATEPSSPNSGWPMATLAAILRVRLEKPGAYVLDPGGTLSDSGGTLPDPGGTLPDPRWTMPDPGGMLPDTARARRGLALVGRAGVLAYVGVGLLALGRSGVYRWS